MLSEPGVTERDLKARAKALKKLGSIFQVLHGVLCNTVLGICHIPLPVQVSWVWSSCNAVSSTTLRPSACMAYSKNASHC